MIEQEINESEYFLALTSERALSKSYVQYERQLALDNNNKPFIPIRLEPCSLPKKLSELQWVDLFPTEEGGLRGNPEKDFPILVKYTRPFGRVFR